MCVCARHARLQRWAVLLSAYTYDIRFKSTSNHSNADGLSRLPLPTQQDSTVLSTQTTTIFNITQIEALPITATEIGSATKHDKLLSKVYRYTKTSWPAVVSSALQPYQQRQHELTVEGNCLMWGIRVIVPSKQRDHVLKELHRDHPGCSRMKSLT